MPRTAPALTVADDRSGRDPWNRAIARGAVATAALLAALAVTVPVRPAAAAPAVQGAAVAPSTIVRAAAGAPVDVTVCPSPEGRPSDVAVIDRHGRQYRTTADGRRWIRGGRTVAVRRGHRVYVRHAAYVATWCER